MSRLAATAQVLLLLAPAAALAAGERAPVATLDARLAAGGLAALETRGPSEQPRAIPGETPTLLYRRLMALASRGAVIVQPPPQGGPARPAALGDRLVLSVDDDLGGPVDQTYETRWDVSGGVAGAADVLVTRFPSRALAQSPPFRISDVLVGFDDLHGATTWPRIRLALEDPAAPLRPGAGVEVTSFSPGLAPAPPESLQPTQLLRSRVGLSVDVPDDFISDGAFDDDFSVDGPLTDTNPRWLECHDGTCGSFGGLQVLGGRVVRGATGANTIAIKRAEPSVEAVRPADDLDQDVTVTIDATDPGFQQLGLAVRVVSSDAYYYVEWDDILQRLFVGAMTPSGPQFLQMVQPVPLPGGVGDMRIHVHDQDGAVVLDIQLGTFTMSVVDTMYLIRGTSVGLSATGTTSGEAWSNLRVQRRRDAFVLVDVPPGEDAGLPLDVSADSLASGAALVSTDGGATASLRAVTSGCINAGNPFVQLEVEETDAAPNDTHLFAYEANIVTLALDCPTCPTALNPCVENDASDERVLPVYTRDLSHTVRVKWWNEHLLDDDSLSFSVALQDRPCDVGGGLIVASNTFVVGADAGQLTEGPALHEASVMTFTAPAPGDYCLSVRELHGPPAYDANTATYSAVRDVRIAEGGCTPLATANLVGSSLRLARPPADARTTTLTWAVSSGFPGRFNVHLQEAERLPQGLCFHEVAPIYDRVVGRTTRTYDLPAPASGRALWMAVFEQDGCASGNSVFDDSLNDPALPCWP